MKLQNFAELKDYIFVSLSTITLLLLSWIAYSIGVREISEIIFAISLIIFAVFMTFKVFERVEVEEKAALKAPKSDLAILKKEIEKSLQIKTLSPLQSTLRKIILDRLSIKENIDAYSLTSEKLGKLLEEHQLLASIVEGHEIRFKSSKDLEDLLAEIERWFE